MEETDGALLPDDVVREILLRVPTDAVAALFRCAVTCKRWRALVADLSFLRRHWPQNACHPSSLLGFFDKRDDRKEPPFFYPVSPGSVLGARRRSLTSFVPGIPGGILNDALPLAATRGGLLLVGLAGGDSLRLAVCDILAGTCDVLPPLNRRVSPCRCAILAREDCCSMDGQQGRTPSTGHSAFFKVLAMVTGRNDQDCNLYTFLSSEPDWSEPTDCSDKLPRRRPGRLQLLLGVNCRVIVCRGVAYWLGSYSMDQWNSLRDLTFCFNVNTGQISLTELSIPANQLASSFGLMLGVAVDGNLSLFQFRKEGLRLKLNLWTRGDDGTWLRTRAIELKPPEQAWNPVYAAVLSGEKGGPLFMADLNGRVHKTDPETGVMEDVTAEMFQDGLGIMAVPIEIDWPALFMSRLLGV